MQGELPRVVSVDYTALNNLEGEVLSAADLPGTNRARNDRRPRSYMRGQQPSLAVVSIQERGLLLLIGLAVLVSGLLLLVECPAPEALLVSDAILLEDIEILLPVFVQAKPIDINHASQAELISLPGIGPALAQRIIDYRSEHGPFQSIDRLQNVSGIGPQTVQDIQNLTDAVAQ